MGLRDMFRAIREYPTARAELETARTELSLTKQTLEQSTRECERLEADKSYTAMQLSYSEQKLEAVRSVLEALCPKQVSLEEMKKLYEMVAPNLDASGFTLYRNAKKLTGIDVHTFFPYEENRGMFEQMDGRQLLDCLLAARFDAVSWEIVDGGRGEKAVFRKVDTTTPEYQAFEHKLYRTALARMGFEGILAPEVTQTMELKLYSPLSAELVEDAPARDWIDEPEPPDAQTLDGEDLTAPVFHTAILKGIEAEQAPEEAERGLMLYYHGPEAVKEKVVSLFPTVEEVDGKLYGVAVCQIREQLTPDELAELKEFCAGQYADGWGEGYEQRPRKTEYGDLYVSFWQGEDYFILTKAEMEAARAPAHTRHQPQRGGEAR